MSILHDLLYSLRSLRKAPGFSFVVIVTMALGIGANAAVFSLIHVMLLRPLPYPDPSHLLKLYEAKTPNAYSTQAEVAPGNFLDWQKQARAFADMAAASGFNYNLTGKGLPEYAEGEAISADWFKVLGVHAELGRDFRPEEDSSSGAPVVMLSDQLWRRRYNADPGIIGKPIGINGQPYIVVGVMPPKSDFREDVELWIPLQRQVRPDRMLWRDARFLDVIARPKPGVSMGQAAADLNRVAVSIRQAHPTGDISGAAGILTLQEQLTGDMRGILLVSLATVVLVLLVACANVANLMLLRITGRAREIAIRLSLGARPKDLLRQLLTEGICLGVAAGTLGLMIGQAGKRLLLWLLAWQSPELSAFDLSWPVLLFTFSMALLAGVIFALVPAVVVVRGENHDLIRRASSGNTVEIRGRRLRQAFVIAEIACSIVLLVGTGLLVRSFDNLRHQRLGFETHHRMVVLLSLPRIRYQRDADVVRFYEQVAEKVRALPGVQDAALTYRLPLHTSQFGVAFRKVGAGVSEQQFQHADLRLVDSHLFATLEVPLLRGRLIAESDRGGSEPVCVINLAMARKYWPDQDPLGQLLMLTRNDVNGEQRPRRIVGIVGDTRDRISEEPQPMIYVPYAQVPFFTMELLVHTRDSAESLRKAVGGVLAGVDPDQPIRSVHLFDSFLPDALAGWTTAITLLSGLAMLALLLTALGVFAVIAYMVRERTREIGIRMAVGATPQRVRNMVLRHTVWLVAIGAVAGTALGAVCTRFLGALIYGVRAVDPLTFGVVAAVIAVVALTAGYLPARRAMHVDPMLALRDE